MRPPGDVVRTVGTGSEHPCCSTRWASSGAQHPFGGKREQATAHQPIPVLRAS